MTEIATNLKLPVSRDTRRGHEIKRQHLFPSYVLYAIRVAIFLALVACWEIGAHFGWVDVFFWSRPSEIARSMVTYFSEGTAVSDTLFTFQATLIGFVLGTVIGALLGLSFWWSRNYAEVMETYIVVFNAIPKVALAPLLILLFGLGMESKIALAVLLISVITALSTISGVRNIDPDLEKLMYSLGAKRWAVFTKVVIPATMPWIISSLRVTIGFALAGVITAEFISSRYGLGRTILYASNTYDMALVWDAIILLSILAGVLYVAVVRFETFLLRGISHS